MYLKLYYINMIVVKNLNITLKLLIKTVRNIYVGLPKGIRNVDFKLFWTYQEIKVLYILCPFRNYYYE